MLTLLTLKSTLKKTWTWLRHNWYVPAVVIYTLVLWFLFKNKAGALKVLEIRSKSYESQIKTIEEAHKKEIEARDQILKNYDIGAFELAIWSDEPGNDPFERKFGSNGFEIRSIKNKLRTRKFRVALNNRQAPFSLTLPGPPSIRGATTSYKTEE